MDTERNLMFALVTLQMDLVPSQDMAQWWSEWQDRPEKDFADFLVEKKLLQARDRDHLCYLVERKLEKHQGDVQAGLASLFPGKDRAGLDFKDPTFVQRTVANLVLPPPLAEKPDTPPLSSFSVPSAAAEPVRHSGPRFQRHHIHAAGGIGQVWQARDQRLDREVALKEIRPELAGDSELSRRFLAEAHITGQLEHPGIVPVYEYCPSEEGQPPYYVMRFIKGQTLSDRIQKYHQKKTTLRTALERTQLLQAFVAVGQAVAFAHSRGILHRDLKGQNVLLGDFGEVILLDWGLAKRVEGDARGMESRAPIIGGSEASQTPSLSDPNATLSTASAVPPSFQTLPGQVMGTPYYMSPEQASGKSHTVDARSDVYSLGAILYEILTGQPPFADRVQESAPIDLWMTTLLNQICQENPTPPRRLSPEVPGALQAVCLKALAKDPKDRYAAATELVQDIQRWLADEPVGAYPEPALVRAGRWARRHKTLVSSLAVLLIAGLVGLGITTVLIGQEQNRTRLAKIKAERNFQKAVDAVDRFYTRVSEERLLNEHGLQPLRKDLLTMAREFYEDFARDQGHDLQSRKVLGETLVKLGRILAELGERKEALKVYEKGRDIFTALAREDPGEPSYPIGLAQCLMSLGRQSFLLEGFSPQAKANLEEACTVLNALVDKDPALRNKSELGHAHTTLAAYLLDEMKAADPGAAQALEPRIAGEYQAVLKLWKEVADEDPDHPQKLLDLAGAYSNLGIFYDYIGQRKKVGPVLEEALALRRRLVERFPDNLEYQAYLAAAHNNIGLFRVHAGKFEQADAAFREALDIQDRLVSKSPNIVRYRNELGNTLFNQGNLEYRRLSQDRAPDRKAALKKGRDALDRALDIWVRLAREYPGEKTYPAMRAQTLAAMAHVHFEIDPAAAMPWYDQAITLLEDLIGKGEKSKDLRFGLTNCYWGRAEFLTGAGQLERAVADWDKALEFHTSPGPPAWLGKRTSARLRWARELARSDCSRAAAQASLLTQDPLTPGQMVHTAQIFADCCKEKDKRADDHARQAVELLHRAFAAGFFQSPEDKTFLESFRKVPAVSGRPDFQKLLREIEKGGK